MNLNKLVNWGIFLLLTIIWGSSFILMKHSKEELNASQIAALRIFSAGLIFIPFAIFHLSKIPRKKIGIVLLSGITGNLLPAFLYANSIAKNIDSSLASILNSLTPVFVVIIAIGIFRDRIKTLKIAGVLIGFGGLTLLFFSWNDISFENFTYASLILFATLFYGININMVSHYLQDLDPIPVTTVSISFMTIPTAFVLWQQDFFDLSFDESGVQWVVAEAILLGIVGTAIATGLFYLLIKRAGGLFASLVTYAIPFVGIFWGVMDGENVTLKQIGCLTIILVGVYLVNLSPKKESKTEVLLPGSEEKI